MEKLKSAIAPSNREAIAKALYQCVSETAVTTMLAQNYHCLLYTSPSPRDSRVSRMPSSA